MKKCKILLAALLAVAMMVSLCACVGGEPADKDGGTTTTTPTTTTTTKADDGKVTYKATVLDNTGAPVVGAMVQICKETCLPGVTNESGVATFQVAEDAYKASILSMPEGYDYTTEEQEFYFDGEFDVTIVLKAVA